MNINVEDVKFDQRGLVPAIVQDARTGRVLMLAYMNAESLSRTLETGETWFWSRSRSSLWHKGESSGNIQRVIEARLDCDCDTLLVAVEPEGPACHTGKTSCFDDEFEEERRAQVPLPYADLAEVLDSLYRVIESRKQQRPEGSYTTYLFNQGLDKILKKLGEESSETIIAAKNEDPSALVKETSDLLYHLIVLLVERGVTLEEVRDELLARRTKQGGE
jgi:phosphoribosyl-AMP cyclohydrolase / phosphoribosyl-ATP pyrophosphohydrolase